MVVESLTVAVRCRTSSTHQILVHIDRDNNVHHITRRWKSNDEAVDSTPSPPLPAKRWWGMNVSDIHPKDRDALHKFLGLS